MNYSLKIGFTSSTYTFDVSKKGDHRNIDIMYSSANMSGNDYILIDNIELLKDGQNVDANNNNYVVVGAVADSIRGPWKHCKNPVFDKNGGHAMFFKDKDGNDKMCMHCPECAPLERALILDVEEKDGEIVLKRQ